MLFNFDLRPFLMHDLMVRAWFNFADRVLMGIRRRYVTLPATIACLGVAAFILTGCRTASSGNSEALEVSHVTSEPPVIAAQPSAPVIHKAAPVLEPQRPLPEAPLPQSSPLPEASVPQSPVIAKPPAPLPKIPIAADFQWRRAVTDRPYIALTFDDGPNPINTPALLDILKQRRVPATFFVLGQNAAAFPRILQRMAAEGHEIASHGWNHASMMELTPEDRLLQVRKTNEAIERAVGKGATLIRPPYGATSHDINRWLTEELKMTVVLWSVDCRDWQYRDPVRIQREILSATKPGAIVLAHDIHRTTVAAMPATLDALLAKGYKFVTVSELLAAPQR